MNIEFRGDTEEYKGSGSDSGYESTGSASSDTPILDNFSRDLTALAVAGKLDPVVGREEEVKRIIQILSRRKK